MANWPVNDLGFGDYVLPDPRKNLQAYSARIVLIESAKRLLPYCLERLHESVYSEFCALPRELPESDGLLARIPDPAKCADRVQFDKTLNALASWMEEFNAGEDWIRDGAWRTMHYWRSFPVCKELRAWQPPLGPDSISLCETGPFRFHYIPWFMEAFQWRTYQARLTKEFTKALKDYRDRCEATAKAKKLLLARRTYSERNFDWFVLYQFGVLSSTKIADRVGGDDSAILRGVKAVQRLVEWKDLRPNPATRKTR